MIFYFEPNFIEKFLWESGFSNFGRNRNDAKWKSVIWPPFWNGTNILYFFSWKMVVISVYTYGVKIIKKFRWESGFLWGGSMEPPLCTNGSAGYLMQLSVKRIIKRASTCLDLLDRPTLLIFFNSNSILYLQNVFFFFIDLFCF